MDFFLNVVRASLIGTRIYSAYMIGITFLKFCMSHSEKTFLKVDTRYGTFALIYRLFLREGKRGGGEESGQKTSDLFLPHSNGPRAAILPPPPPSTFKIFPFSKIAFVKWESEEREKSHE